MRYNFQYQTKAQRERAKEAAAAKRERRSRRQRIRPAAPPRAKAVQTSTVTHPAGTHTTRACRYRKARDAERNARLSPDDAAKKLKVMRAIYYARKDQLPKPYKKPNPPKRRSKSLVRGYVKLRVTTTLDLGFLYRRSEDGSWWMDKHRVEHPRVLKALRRERRKAWKS